LRVIGAASVGIADGHALNVGVGQEMKHDAQALSADADESNIDLVARGNVAGSAQYATRNDGKTNRRRGALSQELAA
jgi:hypothetical protein